MRVGHVKIYFGLLAYLLAAFVSVEASVLCFGDDGHVALETAAADGSCTSSHAESKPLSSSDDRIAAGVESGSDHCGPCTDLPAWSAHDGQAATTFSGPAHPSAGPAISPMAIARRPTPVLVPSGIRVKHTPLGLSPALRSVRSTVLLI